VQGGVGMFLFFAELFQKVSGRNSEKRINNFRCINSNEEGKVI